MGKIVSVDKIGGDCAMTSFVCASNDFVCMCNDFICMCNDFICVCILNLARSCVRQGSRGRESRERGGRGGGRVTPMNKSCHTYERVTHVNESCRTCGRVMSHIRDLCLSALLHTHILWNPLVQDVNENIKNTHIL